MKAAPAVLRPASDAPIRILCTEITPHREIHERAARDLGFALAFEEHDFVDAQRIAATEPSRYDVYDQCFHNLDIVWHWNAIQPIEVERIDLWNEVSDLTKKGKIGAAASLGFGDAPVTRLYVQEDRSLSGTPAARISMLPTVHNFDSFAVHEGASSVDADREVRSWAELLQPRWHGRLAIVDEPAIGFFDIALALRAAGRRSFHNLGRMSVEEIDGVIDSALELKRNGHLAGLWRTADEACRSMAEGNIWISSIWSPSVIALKEMGVKVRQAVPVEGYRAWHGGLCLAAHLKGHRLDRAYAYLNWSLSGWAGAVAARQGYYMPVPERVREHLTSAEWDYWYDGRPAREVLNGPDGRAAIRPGEVRSGGSYWSRASHIALWNTAMDEHNYLIRRWAELTGETVRKTSARRSV